MAAALPGSLCLASQRPLSFGKHEQLQPLHGCLWLPPITFRNTRFAPSWQPPHHNELLTWSVKAYALQRVKVLLQYDATAGDGQWSSWQLLRYQFASAMKWLVSKLGSSEGSLENSQSSKSTCLTVKSPRWDTLCSEGLFFCAADAGAFYFVGAFKIFGKLNFELSVFSGEVSWDEVAFVGTAASCCFRLLCKLK